MLIWKKLWGTPATVSSKWSDYDTMVKGSSPFEILNSVWEYHSALQTFSLHVQRKEQKKEGGVGEIGTEGRTDSPWLEVGLEPWVSFGTNSSTRDQLNIEKFPKSNLHALLKFTQELHTF
jgi:hypothetical protein